MSLKPLLSVLVDKFCRKNTTVLATGGIHVLKRTRNGHYRGNTVRITETTYLLGILPIYKVHHPGYIVTSTPDRHIHPNDWEPVKGSNYLDIGSTR